MATKAEKDAQGDTPSNESAQSGQNAAAGVSSEALANYSAEMAEAEGANVEYTELSAEESQGHADDFFAGKLSPGINLRFETRGGQSVAVASKRS